MKKLLLSVTLVLAANSNAVMAMDKAYIDKAMVRVCQAIQSNSKIKLNNTLKAYRLNYKTISEKLVCNGQDVLTFAS